MKFFFGYLFERRRAVIVFIIFSAVFASSFALYGLPLRAVTYPAAICAFIGAAMIAADFFKALRRHRRLGEILKLPAELIEDLPEPQSLNERDYQEIVLKLKEEARALELKNELGMAEMTEYYTVWVHQIKTPIASMRLRLQNEDSPLSRRLSSDLFRIEQYVEMVLAYMRLESDSSDYVIKEYPLDPIIRQAIKRFAAEFIDRKISLEYKETDMSAVIDEKWLLFVLEQIISNALKYTRSGSVKITVGEGPVITVSDTGIGIAPEDLPRIFEKGYTGCNGRTDKQASGLGLYLCKRIIDRLGAKISVSSEIDKGTSVSLDLSRPKVTLE